MSVWIVQGWWFRDEIAKIIGVFATRKAAETRVRRLSANQTIWTYDITRYKVKS